MPPKKPKKTKAELEEERLAREEEDRKAREKEEKRIAEENERNRLEELRIKAEQKEVRRKELERLAAEFEAMEDETKSREQQLIAEEKAGNSKSDWLRYKNPSEEPDASLDKDMNTFISQMRGVEVPRMKDAVELIKKIERISATVEDVWSDSLAQQNHTAQLQAQRNLEALQTIMYEKLDAATVQVLRFVEKHLNDRTEINIEEVATKLSVGIWASMSEMRPTRKSVQLEKMGVQVDIPKQILQQHEKYVFRVVRMPIVTYNLNAYHASRPTAAEMQAAAKFVVGDLVSFDILNSLPAAYQLRARRWTMRDNSASSLSIRKASYPSSVACRMIIRIPESVVISDDMHIAVWSEEQKEWTEDGISEYQYSEASRSVQFYLTTVGILALVKSRVVDLPYKHWTLTPVHDKKINSLLIERLVKSEEAAKAAVVKASTAAANLAAAAAEDESKKEGEATDETGEIPGDDAAAGEGKSDEAGAATAADGEAATAGRNTEAAAGDAAAVAAESDAAATAESAAEVAAADGEEKVGEGEQNADGGDAEEFDSNSSKFDAKRPLSSAGAVVVGYGNLGKIISRSTGELERHARFTLQMQSHELLIDVVGSHCVLVLPDNATFADLIGVKLTPGCLLYRLQRKGINLLPTAADLIAAKHCTAKDATMELNVLNQMARGSSSLEFSSARWNQTLNPSQIGLLARESTAYASFTESYEHECILAELDAVCKTFLDCPELGSAPGPGGGLKYTLVFGNEYGNKKNFSHVPRPGEIPHLQLRRVLQKRITRECEQRLERVNARFQKTVLTFLSMIKPLSLC